MEDTEMFSTFLEHLNLINLKTDFIKKIYLETNLCVEVSRKRCLFYAILFVEKKTCL